MIVFMDAAEVNTPDHPHVQGVIDLAKKKQVRPVVKVERGTKWNVVHVNLTDRDVASSTLDEREFEALPGVYQAVRVSPHYISVKDHAPRAIQVGSTRIGHGEPCRLISGPCTVDRDHVHYLVESLVGLGIKDIRGGCWKMRSRPGSFPGLGEEGVRLLLEAATACQCNSVWIEVYDTRHVEIIKRVRDAVGFEGEIVLWIGARTGNQELLLSLGRQLVFPVMMKHGLNDGIDDFLLRLDFIARGHERFDDKGKLMQSSNGTPQNNRLMACVRGKYKSSDDPDPHRFIPNPYWVDELKRLTGLPIVGDPSHSGGEVQLVFDDLGLLLEHRPHAIMIESHPVPEEALCDQKQAIPLERMAEVIALVEQHNRSLDSVSAG